MTNLSRFSGTRAAFLTIFLARLVINMQVRAVLPFLPALARGSGVSFETISLLITGRALAGVTSPLFGVLSDRYGRKPMMYVGLLAVVVGTGLAAVAPSFGVLLLGFVVLGFARASYDPAAQAYVSDLVPYERRARMLGMMEFTWALAWLIGAPLTGWLIERHGWRSPFALLAGLAVICLVLTWLACAVPSTRRTPVRFTARSGTQRRAVWLTGPVVGALATGALITTANNNMFMVYGEWMETHFGVSTAVLGVASMAIAAAELAAELAVAGVVDRLGKERALFGGIILTGLAYLLLPVIGQTFATAILGMTILFLCAEFTIVTTLPLLSEVAPGSRGAVMAAYAALVSVAILVMSLVSPRLWALGGLWLNALTSAVALAAAGLILWRIRPALPSAAGVKA